MAEIVEEIMLTSVDNLDAAKTMAEILSLRMMRVVWVYQTNDRLTFRFGLGIGHHLSVGYAAGNDWFETKNFMHDFIDQSAGLTHKIG